MSTAVADSMTDHSVLDGTGDAINGSEVDANTTTLAQILDGTTATDLGGGTNAPDFLKLRIIDLDNATGAVQRNLNIEWDPADGAQMTDNTSGVGIEFKMPDSADNQDVFGAIDILSVDDTSTTERGGLSISLQPGSGTLTEVMTVESGLTTTGTVLNLSTAETTVVDGDILGRIDFQAPSEASGTDSILVGASIWAEADDTFAADNNDTDLVFAVAESETAAERMRLSYDGTAASLALVGATTMTLSDGSITDSSGAISFGNESLTTTGVITGLTVEATGDTAAGDNAAMGYTSTEGLILTGQGSTNDITLKNDADAVVMEVATGTNDVKFAGGISADGAAAPTSGISATGDLVLGATSTIFVGDTANTNMTVGITIKQTTGLVDEWLAFKNDDVAHGVTDRAETDTNALFRTVNANGGLEVDTFMETGSPAALIFRVTATDDNTTKSTAGNGTILFDARKKSGTDWGAQGADANSVVFASNGTARFIFDTEGSGHADVEWTTFSDSRLKSNIVEIPYGVNEIKLLNPVKFTRQSGHIDDNGNTVLEAKTRTMIGFLAQEVKTIIPEVVKDIDETLSFYSLNDGKLMAVVVKALKEIIGRVETLEAA